MLDVILAAAVVLAAASVFGVLARAVGQPAVIGHIVAGIVLSPSLLGALPGGLTEKLIPPDALHGISLLAQFGLILFMFSLGADVNRGELRRRPRAVPIVASATLAVPLLLGTLSAVALRGWYEPAGTSTSAFVLFLAVALSITALPVLAAIVREHGLTESAPAAIAMTSAALIDAVGWLLLAVALLGANDAGTMYWGRTIGFLALFAAVMVLIVRPALNVWRPASRYAGIAVATALAVGAGWVTTALGLHAILGAFVAGLVFPRDKAASAIIAPVRQSGVLLLPLFLVLSGLSTDVGGLRPHDLATLVLILALAVLGKLGVGWAASRAAGLDPREAATVGVLLNTRGVTELVVLSIGLKAGIIEPHLYTVFVLMALLTSAATGPLLSAIRRSSELAASRATSLGRATPVVTPAGRLAPPSLQQRR